MQVIKEGHTYELENFEDRVNAGQVVQFIEKQPIEGTDHLGTIQDGTTNEEVLKMLIDRMNHLQSKFPCKANAIVITNLEESLMWLNKRTEDRIERNVEGKNLS